MALDDDLRVLAGVGLFEEFSPDQLRLVAFGAENVRLPAGETLYREHGIGDCAFVVASGRVVLFRDAGGERRAVGTAHTGAILGELALISGSRRLTGAAAETEVDLIRLNRTLFRRILDEYPDLAAALYRRIAGELQALARSIDRVAPRIDPGEE